MARASGKPLFPIHLTHCIGTMRLGGAEKQLAELICRLPRERYQQTLVLVQGGGPLIERVRAAGCEVIELGYQMKYRAADPRCYFAMGSALLKFVRHLRRHKTTILHAQLFWANILSVAAGRLARVPVVITSRLQLSDYKQGRPRLQRIENLANRFTDAFFANSEAVRRDVLAHERIDETWIRVIYNGVVIEDFNEGNDAALDAELGLGPRDIVVIAVANLHPYKGHADLIRAVHMLRKKVPNLKLLIPGRDQGARAEIEALTASLDLRERVRILGERSDIPALLARADIFVHPSHQEGFSNAILEAMTAGKPAVVTSVGGNAEAVEDGVNGFIVAPRSPEQIAHAIEELALDPELRAKMGKASRRRIEEEFSMRRMIEHFDAWYQQLARKAGRG